VAATCLADPAAFARLGRLVIMGGAVFGRGNITAHAEYNFFVDPEAVAIVLRSPVEKLIVPLEVCEQVVLERRQVVEWSEIHRSPSTRFLRDITEHYMNFYRAARGVDGCHPHDAIALAAVLKPSLFRWERSELMVELGEERRGQLRVATDGAYPVSVATDVDSPALLALLRERLWELSSSEARRLGSVSPH
jgi:inosine-uridine nucleoside N-ribohydrolase